MGRMTCSGSWFDCLITKILSTKPIWLFLCLTSLLFITTEALAVADNKEPCYPLRPFYPTVKTINTTALQRFYTKAIIIDVRSRFEFDVIHINKAEHIPIDAPDFIATLRKYRSPQDATPLIFYGNDSGCTSIFQAALLAQDAGYNHVFVYDGGVFPLLRQSPEKITLMATTPAEPNQVIPNNYYKKVRIDFKSFKAKSTDPTAVVIDIRDLHNKELNPQLDNIRSIPMESFLKAVSNRIWKEKKLLFFDHDGQKTDWLQFFLQANGYSNYTFLKKGMTGLKKNQTKNIPNTNAEVCLKQEQILKLAEDSNLKPIDFRLINILIGSIQIENHVLLKQGELRKQLQCTNKQLESAAQRLRDGGYLLFAENNENLFFRIDPKLAWKGEMAGTIWLKRCSEFRNYSP